MAIVVTPPAAAIVVAKAGTTVMTVESVRVATPPRVPEVARAPLRERPGLGLGHASRSQTDEPEPRGNDKCRYCNASNVFHAQFVPSELPNLSGVRTLDIPLQRQGDAVFRTSVVAEIAAGTPQKPMDCSARRKPAPAACRVTRSAPSCVGRAARRAATHGEVAHARRARLSPWDTPTRQTAAADGAACEISRAGVISVL
jgi:hypothetical protein